MSIHILPTVTESQRQAIEAKTGRVTTVHGELIPKNKVVRGVIWTGRPQRPAPEPTPPSAA